MQFIDLHKQYERLEDQINEGIQNVLNSTAFVTGPEVRQLEEKLAQYVGVKHAICCASGTDALTIPLMAYELTKEDVVFVPSFTFFASAESVVLAGGSVVFVDSDETTFNIDPVDLEQKIEKVLQEGKQKPRGIVAVDLFGQPAPFAELRRIADKYGLFILEDAAQGFGATLNGKHTCTFGDVAGTSFFPSKPLACYGDGGAIFTNDDALYAKMESIHVHGHGSDKYDNIRIGLNSRLDSIQAAVLLAKLTVLDEELVLRNQVAAWYTEQLQGVLATPVITEGCTSAWAQYTVRAESREQRQKIMEELGKAEIPVMVYYPIPIHKSGAFSGTVSWNMERCEKMSDVVFSLPMYPYITKEDVTLVCDTLKKILA